MTPAASWLNDSDGTIRTLLTAMADDPSGAFAPSVYETGRVVRHTPSLSGHDRRIGYLLDAQGADGRWGGPGDYDLVPTLSATEALLAESTRPGGHPRAGHAAERGLRALAHRLTPTTTLPDTVAVEAIVPALVTELNAHLERRGAEPLPVPESTNPALLDALRGAAAQGHALPEKLLHSLELVGEHARAARFVTPVEGRVVGCSPAATAVWLGDDGVRSSGHPCVEYLESVQAADGGMPVAAPLALFERSWVLSTLADSDIDPDVPSDVLSGLLDSVHAAFGDEGAAGGAGLPPDVDDTATALHALSLWKSPRSAECLWHYADGDHFACFPAERTPSPSANAHVLQALGAAVAPETTGPVPQHDRARYSETARTVTRWLCEWQHPDGSWTDKWHASPYYATVCCATALARYGGDDARRAVRGAVDWVLTTQRSDGSWGRWFGTREETAYAVRLLLRA
ncbi:prenyltransferase/squalene oxidase repeat-containing protein, partial [Saccharomonospora saliphila]|uniref:prenyltransferase/squalene oxidase repeat-containing protein n=1 Tax=Saccharomonospora saliphila TaxID=369829 RepID=UPI0003829F68